MNRLKWTFFLVLIVTATLRLGYCVDEGGGADEVGEEVEPETTKCDDTTEKDWKEFCSSFQQICVQSVGPDPKAECVDCKDREGFNPDTKKCEPIKLCTETNENEGKSWADFCGDSKRICVESSDKKELLPKCVACEDRQGFNPQSKQCEAIKLCTETNENEGKSWADFCGDSKQICVESSDKKELLPKCVRCEDRQGFNTQSKQCEAIKRCTETKENEGKNWAEFCADTEQKCVESSDKIELLPKCVSCEDGQIFNTKTKQCDPKSGVVTCKLEKLPDNLKVKGTCVDVIVGTECDFECGEGFERQGPEGKRKCKADGKFEELPTCKVKSGVVTCKLEKLPDNLKVKGTCENVIVGVECDFECGEGFDRQGTAGKRKCKADGKFEELPTCKAKACTLGTLPDHLKVKGTCKDVVFGGDCDFECDVGFDRQGTEGKIKCNKEGKFDTLPTCKAKTCKVGKLSDNLKLVGTCENVQIGGECSFVCEQGFKLKGSTGKIKCQNDGSLEDLPTCTVVGCKDIMNASTTWEAFCTREPNRKCEDGGETHRPLCVCKDQFKLDKLGVCIAQTCEDTAVGETDTWKARCERDGKTCRASYLGVFCFDEGSGTLKCNNTNEELVVTSSNGAQCECTEYHKKENGACVAQKCGDTNRQGVTWTDYCKKSTKKTCKENAEKKVPECVCVDGFKGNGKGRCTAQSCDEVKGKEPWLTCLKDVTQECQVDLKDGPSCVCKQGFKRSADKDKCVPQECSDVKQGGETWATACVKLKSECVKGNNATTATTCVCPTGFKEDPATKICKPQTCGETRNGGKTWNAYCTEDQGGKKCASNPEQIPVCVAFTCADKVTADKDETWAVKCGKPNMTCVENHGGDKPGCVCNAGYKEDSGACKAKTCEDSVEGGTEIWKDVCTSKRTNMECKIQSGIPKCVCKEDYTEDGPEKCKEKVCNLPTMPANLVVVGDCKDVGRGVKCKFECEQEYQLEIATAETTTVAAGTTKSATAETTTAAPVVAVPTSVEVACQNSGTLEKLPTCKKITDKICGEMKGQGLKIVSGKCKNAKANDTCEVACDDEHDLVLENTSQKVTNGKITCNGDAWNRKLTCQNKCELPENKGECLLKGATCKKVTSQGPQCECSSNTMNWEQGKGCVFWQSGYSMEFPGIKLEAPKSYAAEDTDKIEKIKKGLAAQLKVIYPDLGKAVVSNCAATDDSATTYKCQAELFFDTFKTEDAVLDKLLEYSCSENAQGECKTSTDGLLLQVNAFRAATPTTLPNPCANEKICLDGSECKRDSNNIKHTCQCNPGFNEIPVARSRDPTVFSPAICQDRNECAEANDCEGNSTCQNTPGTYLCVCEKGFVRDDANPKKCKDVCAAANCGEGSSCKPDGWTHTCERATGQPNPTKDDELKKAETNTIVVGAVLGAILFVVFIIAIVSITKLRNRNRALDGGSNQVEMNRR